MTRLPASVRGPALTSGVIGLIAAAFLVLFYIAAKPWTDAPNEGWFGLANDILTMVQYLALIPVIVGLRRLMSNDARARAWSTAGLAAAAALVVLQLLLVTRLLPFAIQVIPASLCALLTLCWAAAISSAGARTATLPSPTIQLGRAIGIGLPIALVVLLIGFAVTAIAHVSWAWAAGGIPGAAVWILFPLWTLRVSR
jgi:hypothetical protein